VLEFEPASSTALGFGFTCGFLGLLHMEVVQERLEREFDLDLIVTAPNVLYKVEMHDGEVVDVSHAGELPEPNEREEIREPIVTLNCFTPDDHVGDVMELCQNRRGEFQNMEYVDDEMVDAVEAMVEWCHEGSPNARVEGVEVEYEPPEGLAGFEVRW
jgi:GTP-binding protein LepA